MSETDMKKLKDVETASTNNSVIEMMTQDFYTDIKLINRINIDLEFYSKYGKKQDKTSVATSMFGGLHDEHNDAFVGVIESLDNARKAAYYRITRIVQMIPYLFQNTKCPFFYFSEKIGEVSCTIVPLIQNIDDITKDSTVASLAIPVDQNIEFKCFMCSVPYSVIETQLTKK